MPRRDALSHQVAAVEKAKPTIAESYRRLWFLQYQNKNKKPTIALRWWVKSGRQDSNLRPPGPKPGALPACATSRFL